MVFDKKVLRDGAKSQHAKCKYAEHHGAEFQHVNPSRRQIAQYAKFQRAELSNGPYFKMSNPQIVELSNCQYHKMSNL
jgi:hypothetical protein